MADGINELNVRAVNDVVSGAATVIDLSLEAIEGIAIFMIDMYRSLYLCLIDLAIHGSLDLLVALLTEAESFITDAFQDVRTEVQGAVQNINKVINSSISVINDIPGVDIDAPQISVPTLSALSNVTISTSLISSLESLNSSIPTLDELRASLDSLISTPIDALRTQVNSSFSNATISVELLPVPAKQNVDLCGQLDTSFIDEIGHVMKKFAKIGLGLVGLAAVLLIVAGIFWERYRYRAFLEGVARARQAWQMDLGDKRSANLGETLSTPNLLSFLSAAQHPTVSLIFAKVASFFHLSAERRAAIHWFGAYICHPYALMFLALGVVGLLTVEIQLALIEGPLKRAAQDQANAGASDFSAQVLAVVNDKMNSTSVAFANATNTLIKELQDTTNDVVFGWVNSTTTAMNSTLNAFYDGLTDSITDFLGNTTLNDLALDLVYCLVGSKVLSIETGLTWLHDNAHVTLPTVSYSVLMLSSNRTQELTSDMTSPNSSISTTSIVDRMVDRYAASLRQQRLAFIICLAIWGVVAMMGLIGVFWKLRGSDMWAQHRGGSNNWPEEQEKPELRPFHLHATKPSHDDTVQGPPPSLSQYTFPIPSPPPPRSETSPWSSVAKLFQFQGSTSTEPRTRPTWPTLPKVEMRSLPSLPWLDSRAPREPDYYSDRREIEFEDLRTGETLDRQVPAQSGAAARLRAAVAGALRGGSRLGRTGSLTSLGPRHPSYDLYADKGEEEPSQTPARPPTASSSRPQPGLNNPFLDPPPKHGPQAPLSPPPIGVGYPTTFSRPMSSYAPLDVAAFPPMVPSTLRRQPSKYTPSSRPTPNPFATPFDDPGDTR
ncbi:plasma membrane fusion protein PRM1 [Pseudohyphozyma bogoriensis]|nr:plasma membrane fusion protein PRM1 [Pseudohyphozyma bogoriensis]